MDAGGGAGGLLVIGLILAPLALLAVLRLRAPSNRRKHERFKINSDVRISVGDKELVGNISTISLGGAQINTAALLQDGGLITMQISSPDGGEKVEVAGRVVWSEANKAYGVAFNSAPQSVLSRISIGRAACKKPLNGNAARPLIVGVDTSRASGFAYDRSDRELRAD